MLKAAGQQGSIHLHIREVQLLRTLIAQNNSKVFEQLASQILVWICKAGPRFGDFLLGFFFFAIMQLDLWSCKSLRQEVQSKRIVFISSTGTHHKWMVFCRTFNRKSALLFHYRYGAYVLLQKTLFPFHKVYRSFYGQEKPMKMLKLQKKKANRTKQESSLYHTELVLVLLISKVFEKWSSNLTKQIWL